MKTIINLMVITFFCGLSTANASVIYSGYTFDDNAFADSVVSYSHGSDVSSTYAIPSKALGQPEGGVVSLGDGGQLIVQFTDNSLTTSGDSNADLFIFETGPAIEYFNVAISTNGTNWINIGNVKGQPSAIDIDAIAAVTLWEKYSFVRLIDISPNQSGYPYGEADIDAIAAISSAAPVSEPGQLALLGIGLLGLSFCRNKKK